MSMTKEQINYRLPPECCGRCVSSYHNTYGDVCCDKLDHANIVELGGLCDLYTPEFSDNTNTDNSNT